MSGDFRPDAIYVRRETRRALYYIPLEPDQTIDSLCDNIVSDWVRKNHPQIILHLSEQSEADKKFRDSYHKKPF